MRADIADITLDLLSCKAYRNGRVIGLSYTEYRMLLLLLRRSPATVRELHEIVIGRPYSDDWMMQSNTVQVQVHRLRRKLGLPAVIHTADNKAGYRIIAEVSLSASTNR